MYIPYKLHELLCDLSGSFKTNLSLSDICFNTSVSFDLMCTIKAECRVSFMGEVLQSLLERTWLALSAGFTQDQVVPPEDEEQVREIGR